MDLQTVCVGVRIWVMCAPPRTRSEKGEIWILIHMMIQSSVTLHTSGIRYVTPVFGPMHKPQASLCTLTILNGSKQSSTREGSIANRWRNWLIIGETTGVGYVSVTVFTYIKGFYPPALNNNSEQYNHTNPCAYSPPTFHSNNRCLYI